MPKRELLIFDKVAVIELSLLIDTLKGYNRVLEPHMIDEYEWLVENGLVFEPKVDPLIALKIAGRSRDLAASYKGEPSLCRSYAHAFSGRYQVRRSKNL